MPPQNAVNASAATPPRNRHRHRPAAATTATRRGESVPTTSGLRSSPRPRRVSTPVQLPVGACTASATGGRLSHTTPESAGAIGEDGAAAGYHSPSADAVTIKASGPDVARRGSPNEEVSP